MDYPSPPTYCCNLLSLVRLREGKGRTAGARTRLGSGRTIVPAANRLESTTS